MLLWKKLETLLQPAVVGVDQSWLKNEVICMNIKIINNDFINLEFIKSLFIIVIFRITIIMQTYGSSILSTRKFRVQPLAGNYIKMSYGMGLLKACESQSTQLQTLDLMIKSTNSPTVQLTSHILLSFHE